MDIGHILGNPGVNITDIGAHGDIPVIHGDQIGCPRQSRLLMIGVTVGNWLDQEATLAYLGHRHGDMETAINDRSK